MARNAKLREGKAGLVILGGAVLVALGAVIFVRSGNPPVASSSDPAVQAVVVVAQPEPSVPDTVADTSAQTEPSPPTPPSFDVVRVDADGAALIAGNAPPLSEVVIEIDGAEFARVKSDGVGGFAALFDVPLSLQPQVVFLVAFSDDGHKMRSAESVILAPLLEEVAPEPPTAVAALPQDDPAPEPFPTDLAASGPVADAAPTEPDPAPTDLAPTDPAPTDLAASGPASGEPLATDAEPSETATNEAAGATALGTPVVLPPVAVAAAQEAPVTVPPIVEGESVGPTARTLTPQVPLAVPAQPAPGASAPLAVTATGAGAALTVSSTSVPSEVETPAPAPLMVAQPDSVAAAPLAATRPRSAAPAVLLSGAQGVRVLQPSGAVPDGRLAGVIVDAIGYETDGSVTLSGRGTQPPENGGNLRVYLDNLPVSEGVVAADGSFAVDLPEIEAGLYTLRVDQIDPVTGRVASRFETPFQREDPAILARALPVVEGSAQTAAKVITVQPGFTLWGIASANYGDGLSYVKVFEANKSQIRDPDLIYPGQVFDLPQ